MNNTTPTPVDTLLDLSGNTAIVTGASGGIGSAIARRLAEAGADVVVHYYRNAEQAALVVDLIKQNNGNAVALKADLRDDNACSELLTQTETTLGKPTLLINNAGAQPVSDLLNMSTVELNEVLSTNISAPMLLTKKFAALHANSVADNRRRNISVTNIASIEGLQPATGHSHYASTKSALVMFTRAAALELGELGIRVNAVSPGLIDRDGLSEAWPEGVNRYQSAAPLGTIGCGTDIANAVLFLSSSAASWISGSNLVVDGGVSCAPAW